MLYYLVVTILEAVAREVLKAILQLLYICIICYAYPSLVFVRSKTSHRLYTQYRVSSILLTSLSFSSMFSYEGSARGQFKLSYEEIYSLLFISLLCGSNGYEDCYELFRTLLYAICFRLFCFVVMLFLLSLRLGFLSLYHVKRLFTNQHALLLHYGYHSL